MIKNLRYLLNNLRWFAIPITSFRRDKHSILNIFNNIFFLINIVKLLIISLIEFIHFFLIKFYYFFLRKIEVSSLSIRRNHKRCFIIGNGPSLNDLNLKKIKNADIFVCNYFCFSKASKQIEPTYYTLTDGAFFDPSESYNHESKNIKQIIKKNKFILSKILKNNSKKTKFLIPIRFKKNLKSLNVIPHSRINYFNELPYPIEEVLPAEIDNKFGVPFSLNVLISNLNLAISLRYKEIYLIGADQDHYLSEKYTFNLRSRKFPLQKYFVKHKKNKFQLIDANKNILGFWSMYRTFKAFQNISIYAKKKNITIINCSTRGILDTFEYKKFDMVANEKN